MKWGLELTRRPAYIPGSILPNRMLHTSYACGYSQTALSMSIHEARRPPRISNSGASRSQEGGICPHHGRSLFRVNPRKVE